MEIQTENGLKEVEFGEYPQYAPDLDTQKKLENYSTYQNLYILLLKDLIL